MPNCWNNSTIKSKIHRSRGNIDTPNTHDRSMSRFVFRLFRSTQILYDAMCSFYRINKLQTYLSILYLLTPKNAASCSID